MFPEVVNIEFNYKTILTTLLIITFILVMGYYCGKYLKRSDKGQKSADKLNK